MVFWLSSSKHDFLTPNLKASKNSCFGFTAEELDFEKFRCSPSKELAFGSLESHTTIKGFLEIKELVYKFHSSINLLEKQCSL